jgi:hypothetical protein
VLEPDLEQQSSVCQHLCAGDYGSQCPGKMNFLLMSAELLGNPHLVLTDLELLAAHEAPVN